MKNPFLAPGLYGRPPDYGSYPGAPPGMGKLTPTRTDSLSSFSFFFFSKRITGCFSLTYKLIDIRTAPPPGMAAPGAAPGTAAGAAPGTAPPLGLQQQTNIAMGGRPGGGFSSNFQPPPNMPNINFSAPVIRLGTSGPPKPVATPGSEGGRDRGGGYGGYGSGQEQAGARRAGLGSTHHHHHHMDSHRQNARDSMLQLQPPTKDEVVKTIFIGGITEGIGGDDGMERILRSAGSLRRWIRPTDANDKPCTFGFAEYEDPESLATAIEVLKNVEVPVKKQASSKESDEEKEVEKSALLVSKPFWFAECRWPL